MAKIKFKLSLKELSFEFEGDRDTGEKMQTAIGNTLGSLMETQNQIIDVEARQINDGYMLPPSTENSNKSKRKRGNKRSKVNDTNSKLSENGNENSPEKTKRTNRPKGQSARDQIILLIQQDFFSDFRFVADIQDALSKKGHNFDSNTISPTLLRLTKQNYLIRDDSSGKWQYKKGALDVSTES